MTACPESILGWHDREVRSALTVGVAQPVHHPGDLGANARAHAVAVRAAGARLVVFPELSLTGYELDASAIDLGDPVFEPIVDACAATASTALVGAPAREGALRRIATVAVTGDGVAIAYRKTYLSDDERAVFTPGAGPAVLEVDGWRVGLGICKDTRIAEHVDDALALGTDVYVAGLVHPSRDRAELDTRATRIVQQGGVPVAFASAAGFAGSAYPLAAGRSCIWSASGAVLVRATARPGEVVTASLDP